MAAVVALAPRGGLPTCTQCHDPSLRKQWGCDEPAAEPVLDLDCFVCAGHRDDCSECGGTGLIPIRRCPNRVVQQVHLDAVLAAIQTEHGILPVAGGMQDQAATFVEALPLLLREVSHWRQVAEDKARREAQAAAKRGR